MHTLGPGRGDHSMQQSQQVPPQGCEALVMEGGHYLESGKETGRRAESSG